MRPRLTLSTVLLLIGFVPICTGQVIVVDNSDPGFSVLSQTWETISVDGQYGLDYRYRQTSLAAGEVEWRPSLPNAGEYDVSVWYRSGYDRPDDATYTVHHAGGATDVMIDQRLNGSQWVSLGTFLFAAGSSGHVTLTSDAEPARSIVADAVRFYRPLNGESPELRACWLTHYYFLGKSESQLRAAAQNMCAGGINTVYVAMYSGMTVWWPSKAYQAAGGSWGSQSVDYAKYLTDIFHDEGLKVGVWFEYGFALGGASHAIAMANPEWLARDRFGDAVTGENGGFVFISPGCGEAMDMIDGMVRELAENYNFDDIQLDRIRWGRKDTGREYGYEDCTSDLYRAEYGVNPPTNVNNAQWVAFRERLVNEAMERFSNTIKQANPEIVVSSAPTGSYGITQHMQRWPDWVEGGYMDLVLPQMYKTSLGTFQTEFNTQKSLAGAHVDKLGVGYRASESDDWGLVADQLEYARGQDVAHGCLWVYHYYTTQVAIQDELDNLPQAGQPWHTPAYNPFASPKMLQIVVDNRDGPSAYSETGGWFGSAQSDFFRFDSRVAVGDSLRTATFSASVPTSGWYDAYTWHTASGNRNDEALLSIAHYLGDTDVIINQQMNGGQWVPLGQFKFARGDTAQITISNVASSPDEYTSADAVKLVLRDFALGDENGDGVIDAAEAMVALSCLTGPSVGPVDAGCEINDFDEDADIDMSDLAELQHFFGE